MSHALYTLVSWSHQMSHQDRLQWQRGSCVLECLCDLAQKPGIFVHEKLGSGGHCWLIPLTTDWGFTKYEKLTVSCCFPININECVAIVAATWWSQCNLAKLRSLMALDCSDTVWGRGAQNSRQLFALIVWCDSALLNGADTSLINGKCCIFILASGTTQLLRWQGAQCWLHSVTNPTGCPFGLIVKNPIEKQLIDLFIDCLVEQ